MAEWDRKKKQMAQRRAMLQKRKQDEDRLTHEANLLMERAKKSAVGRQFEEAGRFYQQAADIFKELKWDQQASMLETEVQNMVTKKQEFEKNQRLYAEKQQKEKDLFNQRAQQILDEKEKKRQEEEAARRKLSPVLRQLRWTVGQNLIPAATGGLAAMITAPGHPARQTDIFIQVISGHKTTPGGALYRLHICPYISR